MGLAIQITPLEYCRPHVIQWVGLLLQFGECQRPTSVRAPEWPSSAEYIAVVS